MSHPLTFALLVAIGVSYGIALVSTNFFGNSEAALWVLSITCLIGIYSLYGLLAKLALRDDDLHEGLARGASTGMRLRAVPVAVKIGFFVVLLPLLLPHVRRARSYAGVAARASLLWVVIGLLVVGANLASQGRLLSMF